MSSITLDWRGPFAFRDLLTTKERYREFASPGVYVHLRRDSDSSCEYLYVGRASGSPDLMVRQTRHYLGSIGLLYYLEPTLTRKTSSDEDFARAAALLRNRASFKDQVDKVFDEMDSQLVYLAKCDPAEAAVAEARLIEAWKPRHNKRKERAAGALLGAMTIVHRPAPPGTEVMRPVDLNPTPPWLPA